MAKQYNKRRTPFANGTDTNLSHRLTAFTFYDHRVGFTKFSIYRSEITTYMEDIEQRIKKWHQVDLFSSALMCVSCISSGMISIAEARPCVFTWQFSLWSVVPKTHIHQFNIAFCETELVLTFSYFIFSLNSLQMIVTSKINKSPYNLSVACFKFVALWVHSLVWKSSFPQWKITNEILRYYKMTTR